MHAAAVDGLVFATQRRLRQCCDRVSDRSAFVSRPQFEFVSPHHVAMTVRAACCGYSISRLCLLYGRMARAVLHDVSKPRRAVEAHGLHIWRSTLRAGTRVTDMPDVSRRSSSQESAAGSGSPTGARVDVLCSYERSLIYSNACRQTSPTSLTGIPSTFSGSSTT